MSETSLTQKQKQLLTDLQSKNETIITEALKAVPEDGSPEMMPYLVSLWTSNPNQEIAHLLEKVLFNLKDVKVIPVLLNMLKSELFAKDRASIMNVIWQSGLDVSEETVLFTNIAIAGDYMTAFEALTIIDNQEELPEEQIHESIRMLDKAINKKSDIQALLGNLRQIFLEKLLG